jgi:hypothetical protein
MYNNDRRHQHVRTIRRLNVMLIVLKYVVVIISNIPLIQNTNKMELCIKEICLRQTLADKMKQLQQLEVDELEILQKGCCLLTCTYI